MNTHAYNFEPDGLDLFEVGAIDEKIDALRAMLPGMAATDPAHHYEISQEILRLGVMRHEALREARAVQFLLVVQQAIRLEQCRLSLMSGAHLAREELVEDAFEILRAIGIEVRDCLRRIKDDSHKIRGGH